MTPGWMGEIDRSSYLLLGIGIIHGASPSEGGEYRGISLKQKVKLILNFSLDRNYRMG